MDDQNYTDISTLINELDLPSPFLSYGLRESEPPHKPAEHPELKHDEIEEVVEHQPHEEVKEFVEPIPETVEIPPDLKSIGVQAPSNPTFPAYQRVKLPLSDDKVVSGLKAPVTSSLRWISEVCVYLLRQAHLALKSTGGKVVRVLKK